jgi:hypothetical protein
MFQEFCRLELSQSKNDGIMKSARIPVLQRALCNRCNRIVTAL